MKIICISGKAQHGKDTTANFLRANLEAEGKKVLIAHYGDQVKHLCRDYFCWDGVKDEAGRSLLQYVGTDVIRHQSEDFWVDKVLDVLRFFPNEWDYVLIPDCRFPNEIERVKEFAKEYGFDSYHARVVRPIFESPLTPEQQAHPSETALDDCSPDMYVYNIGTLVDLNRTAGLWADLLIQLSSGVISFNLVMMGGLMWATKKPPEIAARASSI